MLLIRNIRNFSERVKNIFCCKTVVKKLSESFCNTSLPLGEKFGPRDELLHLYSPLEVNTLFRSMDGYKKGLHP
jgi:hypothetical protein